MQNGSESTLKENISGYRQSAAEGSCEHGNEPSDLKQIIS
jgi:hypothetical protein